MLAALMACNGGKHEPVVNEKDTLSNPVNYGKDGAPDSVANTDTMRVRPDSGQR